MVGASLWISPTHVVSTGYGVTLDNFNGDKKSDKCLRPRLPTRPPTPLLKTFGRVRLKSVGTAHREVGPMKTPYITVFILRREMTFEIQLACHRLHVYCLVYALSNGIFSQRFDFFKLLPVCIHGAFLVQIEWNKRWTQFCLLLHQQHCPLRAVVTRVNIGRKRQHSILPLVRVVQVCPHFSTNPKWCILHVRRHITGGHRVPSSCAESCQI